jgi:hypothetical protein
VFDRIWPAGTLSLSSIVLLSLDDIAMQDNQCDCDLVIDFVGIHALTLAWSVRMTGNRFKEGLRNAYLSALTVGLFNDTSHNQGTHCFLCRGLLRPRIELHGAAAGATAELQTNRFLVPASWCEVFSARGEAVDSAASMKAEGIV